MNIQKFTTFKTILIALVLTISTNQLFAQTTNGIFFQAVARDNFSNPAKDRKIYVQSSIIQTTPTGTKVLTEEHQANTDATGVFSISLGNGVRVGGTASGLTTIDWSKGPYYLNLKVAITPIGGSSSWDYTKEWVDMGTTSFGAVPFALYSASSAKVDDKLNVSDTTTMLKVYAKAIKVQSLETAVASKLTAADTLTMLAPYAKAAYTIDSSFFKSQLATKLSVADSSTYVTPTQLAAKTFDQTPITNAIAVESSTARAAELLLTNNIASNTASITVNATSIAAESTTARAAELSLSNNVSANTSSITTNTYDIATLNTSLVSNTASITANTAAINLKAPIASPTFTGTVITGQINTGAINASSITAPTYSSTPITLTYSGSTINWNPTLGLNAAITLTQNSTFNFTSTPSIGTYGTIVLTQDRTGGRTISLPNISGVTNKVLGSTSSTTIALSTVANAEDILNFYYDGTNCYWNIGQGYGAASSASSTNLASGVTGTLPVANGGTGATTLTGLIKGNGTSAMTAATAGTDYLAPNGSAAYLTNFPTLNQNTTGNAETATLATTATSATNATTAGNITATSNTTLTSLANLSTVGTITSGTISLTTNIKTTSTITAGTVTYPNVHGTANQVLTTTGSGTLTWTTPSSGSSNTHTIGEFYGDGIVFYTWDNGAHGLIAKVASSSSGITAPGGSNGELVIDGSTGYWGGLTSTAVAAADGALAGKTNSILIAGILGPSSAAYQCLKYKSYSNYGDWYLPSLFELQKLLAYNLSRGTGNLLYSDGNYISSTDSGTYFTTYYSGNGASGAYFGSVNNKSTQGRGIIPIRSF